MALTTRGTVMTANGYTIGEIRSIIIGQRVNVEANFIPGSAGQREVIEQILRQYPLCEFVIYLPDRTILRFPVRNNVAGFVLIKAGEVMSLHFSFDAV